MGQYRAWVFTINNYTEEDCDQVRGLADKACYLIAGLEVGEKEGTPHIQGYVYLKGRGRTRGGMSKLLKRASLRVAAGSEFDNQRYCGKEGNLLIEHGKPCAQGERNDLKRTVALVESGANMRQILREGAENYQTIKVAEVAFKYLERKRHFKPEVTWIWGPTGAGKSEMVEAEAGGDDSKTWTSGRNLRWWNDYDAHENVIIDDFRRDFCTYHELLRILDRYPFTIETKGGFRQLLAKRMWITSCYHPSTVYNTREDIGQLLRRIDRIVYLEPNSSQKSGVVIEPRPMDNISSAVNDEDIESLLSDIITPSA